jgi:hypothetical protein
MDADYTCDVFARTSQCQGCHTTEAEADGGEATVNVGAISECRKAGPSSLRESLGVVAKLRESRNNSLSVSRHAFAEHVPGQHHVAELGVSASLLPSMVVEARPSVDQQNSRALLRQGFVLSEDA